jgi:hypothetical protein
VCILGKSVTVVYRDKGHYRAPWPTRVLTRAGSQAMTVILGAFLYETRLVAKIYLKLVS